MQIFLLGKTKTGKTTLAHLILSKMAGVALYEAGAWARREFSEVSCEAVNELCPIYKSELTGYALGKLAQNPYYSLEQFERWKSTNTAPVVLVAGVRNPDDFIGMLRQDKSNIVIFIEEGKVQTQALETFETGLTVIRDYLDWKAANAQRIPVIRTTLEEILSGEIIAKLFFLKQWKV